jgi:hypothetical protein
MIHRSERTHVGDRGDLIKRHHEERITHRQLAEALGLNRFETDGVLKRYKVSPNVTAQEMRAQATALKDATPE